MRSALLAFVVVVAAPAAPPVDVPVPLHSEGGPLREAVAKAFVRPMLKVPDGQATPPFAWGKFDVVGSGYGEIFLSFRSPGQCSDVGCPLLVMERKHDGSWRPILAAVATSVLARPRGKSADLVVHGAPGQEAVWTWDATNRKMVRADAKAPPAP